MKSLKQKKERQIRRKKRVRSKISGTAEKPRLSVSRSNKHVYAQLIDDEAGVTLAFAHDLKSTKGDKISRATEVGKELAAAAAKKKISEIIFDRNSYQYHGRVKAVAEGAREGGLKF